MSGWFGSIGSVFSPPTSPRARSAKLTDAPNPHDETVFVAAPVPTPSIILSDFDALLTKYGLGECRALLESQMITTSDLVLDLTEEDMREMDLPIGARVRVRRAQKAHAYASKLDNGAIEPSFSAETEFDAFIAKYHLEHAKQSFLDNDLDSIDLVLKLTTDEMRDLNLNVGVRKKIQRAQEESNTLIISGNGLTGDNQDPDCGIPTSVFGSVSQLQQESDPKVTNDNSNWQCSKGFDQHDIFISYRVESEKVTAVELCAALEAIHKGQSSIHVYLDSQCLDNGKPWNEGFLSGLSNSTVIVLILSEKGVQRTLEAHTKEDNQFLEIETALQLVQESATTEKALSLLVITMWSQNSDGFFKSWFPDINAFPDELHIHAASPKLHTIRQTFQELCKLQFLHAADSYAVTQLVPEVRNTMAKTLKAKKHATYRENGPILLAANQESMLQALLSPIDSTDDRKALEKLYVKGTRTWLFDQVLGWVKESDSENTMLWINATAGVGKSVAAAQIANELHVNAQLAAAVFLKYNDIRKNNPHRILATIAYGLCKWYAPIGRKMLERQLSSDTLSDKSIPELFKILIEEPLTALGTYQPHEAVVILVDGLDECSPRQELLQLLVNFTDTMKKQAPWLKIILTSRPEPDIQLAFKRIPTKAVLPSSEENMNDLKFYIKHSLEEYRFLESADVETIIDTWMAGGDTLLESKTFIWINLILSSIKQFSKEETVTLQAILDISKSSIDINAIYKKTLEKAYTQAEGTVQSNLLLALSAIATAQTQLTPKMIAELFFSDLDAKQALLSMHHCLQRLTVLLDPGANGLDSNGELQADADIKFSHKSVADYLLGPPSKGAPYHVSVSFHKTFAQVCLAHILKHDPLPNVCGLVGLHSSLPDFDFQVQSKVSLTLSYSVVNWAAHFLAGAHSGYVVDDDKKLQELLQAFFESHVLYWIECASLLHSVKRVIEQIANLCQALAKNPKFSPCLSLASDTYRFLKEFAGPIIASAPQVYNTGLTFLPTETELSKVYQNLAKSNMKFQIQPSEDTWDPCEMTIQQSGSVYCVDMSPCGNWIVTGTSDKTLKVYDTVSGQLQHVLEGHHGAVYSVAIGFDSDGLWLASCSNEIGHSADVKCIAISPDSSYIVSCSSDKSIIIWDRVLNEQFNKLEGHVAAVSCVAIAKDGKWIASGSHDQTVKIWNFPSGELIHTLDGHTDKINCVIISPDNKWVISGSDDNTVKIWNASTGQLQRSFMEHVHEVHSVAVSPDGQHCLSSSVDKSIKLWDLTTGELIYTFYGHSEDVKCVIFSPDGNLIVSGASDKTVKVWRASSRSALQHTSRHSNYVSAVAISADGKFLATGSWDQTVKVWDALSGQILTTFEGHSDYVVSVTITHDNKYVVSGSDDNTVKVWKIEPAGLCHTLEGHLYSPRSVFVTVDLEWIISKNEYEEFVWDFETGTQQASDVVVPVVHTSHEARCIWEDVQHSGWIKAGGHLVKIPSTLYVKDHHVVNAEGSLVLVHSYPLVVSYKSD
ncbi:hypothetical protein BC830DRAFT_1141173, partial [Chytriomyces sp. MP71]